MVSQPIPTQPQRQAMTTSDIMAKYHLSQTTVYRLVKRGKLPCFKVSNRLRFWAADVEAALEGKPSAEPLAELLDEAALAHLDELVANAAPLTESQRDLIRAVFRSGRVT